MVSAFKSEKKCDTSTASLDGAFANRPGPGGKIGSLLLSLRIYGFEPVELEPMADKAAVVVESGVALPGVRYV